jgi:hypothetical protein
MEEETCTIRKKIHLVLSRQSYFYDQQVPYLPANRQLILSASVAPILADLSLGESLLFLQDKASDF